MGDAREHPGLEAQAGIPCAPPTILVVDAEPTIRLLLLRVLQAAGYRVVAAPGLRAGMDACERHSRIDVVLVDIGPCLAGAPGVARAIASRWPTARLVIMTGENIERLPGLTGVTPTRLLKKPFSVAELLASIGYQD
jgi:DNA-binding response OmpR family regulator